MKEFRFNDEIVGWGSEIKIGKTGSSLNSNVSDSGSI